MSPNCAHATTLLAFHARTAFQIVSLRRNDQFTIHWAQPDRTHCLPFRWFSSFMACRRGYVCSSPYFQQVLTTIIYQRHNSILDFYLGHVITPRSRSIAFFPNSVTMGIKVLLKLGLLSHLGLRVRRVKCRPAMSFETFNVWNAISWPHWCPAGLVRWFIGKIPAIRYLARNERFCI